MNFKSNWIDHVSRKKGELRNSDWTGIGLIVELNGEGKRCVSWKKGGLRSSIWVTRDQREHVGGGGPSGSRVPLNVVGSDQAQVGLFVTPDLEPTGPFWMLVGLSPSLSDPSSLNMEAHTLAMSKASHEALVA